MLRDDYFYDSYDPEEDPYIIDTPPIRYYIFNEEDYYDEDRFLPLFYESLDYLSD